MSILLFNVACIDYDCTLYIPEFIYEKSTSQKHKHKHNNKPIKSQHTLPEI